ncbi:MAG TPA: hypothetical protein VG347_24840 [Verrucomicrobiae bacterium]|nr:hypothetical protein [Verrucomicrobiae bacterium]
MSNIAPSQTIAENYDLFRLSKSKRIVDLSPNTLRDYFQRGLKAYRCGKPVFVSRSELADFIRTGGPSRAFRSTKRQARK